MQKNGRLGNLCLLQVVNSTFEHEVGYAKAKNFIGFLEQITD